MSTIVFLFLLVAALVVCINGIDLFYDENECVHYGGVCTFQRNCKVYDHFRAHCPEQALHGAICCVKKNLIESRDESEEEIFVDPKGECLAKCTQFNRF